MSSTLTQRRVVGVTARDDEHERPETHDPINTLLESILDDPQSNVVTIARHMRIYVDLIVDWRTKAAPIIAQRLAVEPVLNNPTLQDDPRRRSWLLQYDELIDAECVPLSHALWEGYHFARSWNVLDVTARVEHRLHQLVGMDARDEAWGVSIAFTRSGPIQNRAPLPLEWDYPDDLIALLPANVALMLGCCPF